MKNIFQSFLIFIRSLSLIDVLLFLAIVILIILIVSFKYVSKYNKENEEVDDENMKYNDLDLIDITKKIEQEVPKPIILNNYEKEQEEKAIISYDELVASKKDLEEINYKEEKDIKGLKVKEVDMEHITKPIDISTIINRNENKVEEKHENVLMRYDKEDAFLETLKNLQKILN